MEKWRGNMKIKTAKSLTWFMLFVLMIQIYACGLFSIAKAAGNLTFINSYWGSQTTPQKVYPGSSNVLLMAFVRNDFGTDFLSVSGTIFLPAGVQSYDGKENATSIGFLQRNGTTSYNVKAGEIFELNFVLNVLNTTTPGDYNCNTNVTYTYLDGGNYTIGSENVTISFTLSNFPSYIFQIVDVYWTTPGGFRVNASSGSRNLNLNVELRNLGQDSINSVEGTLDLGSNFSPSIATSSVNNVAKGDTFSLSFNGISIPVSTTSGDYNVDLQLNCTFIGYGNAVNTSSYLLYVTVNVSEMPSPGLQIVRIEWQNSDKIYPGARHVLFLMELQNLGDYTITDTLAVVSLPTGFLDSYGNSVINATSSATFGYGSFATLTVGPVYVSLDVDPGIYYAQATLYCLGSKDSSELMLSQNFAVPLVVSEISFYLEPVYSNWLGASPGPGNTAATLLVLIRNNEIVQMRGIYANVVLPNGFISTISGLNSVNVTPSIFASTTQIQDIINMFSGQSIPTGQTPLVQTQAAMGDILALPIQMNVGNDTQIGYYTLDVSFDFLDQWNNKQTASVKPIYWLPGSTLTVDIVEGKSKLLIGSRTSIIELFVRNNGTAAMTDVYIAIAGAPQGISISSTVKYLPVIEPLQEANLTWSVSVNPQSPYIGSLPVLVMISFNDMLGYRHTLNQTAIVYAEGIVELDLVDISISPETPYSAGSLTVSATILNLGTYKARNAEAFLNGSILQSNSGSYSFVGDVDVSAQVPLSLTATLNNVTGDKTVYMTIRYRDVFNEPVTFTFPINITIVASPPQPQPTPSSFFEDYYKIAIFVGLSVFMVVSGFIIYRMYQRTKHKTQGMDS